MEKTGEKKSYILLNNEIMQRKADGSFSFEKDLEALDSFFKDYVNKNTQFFHTHLEKIHYMIENGYYIDFFELYSEEEIEKAYEYAYSFKFRFQSFMAASKFYSSYAMKDVTDEVFLERYEDRIVCVGLFIGQGDIDFAMSQIELYIKQIYQPATPTFLNAGKIKGGQLVSCFLDEIGDSLAGIKYAQQSAMILSSMGGGVAFNLSKLRARGESIRGVQGRAEGVLPIMKILEDTFSYANQLGQRDGAGAAYLNIFHYDIEEFLDCKKINADEKFRIKSLSIGIVIPDLFMELAAADKYFYVFGPHSIYTEYGLVFDDLSEEEIKELYPKLLENNNIVKKKFHARTFLVKIAAIQKESGYPYIFFSGNAQRGNPLKEIGKIKFSNLCTEIMQISEVSDIQYPKWDEEKAKFVDESEYEIGISCNLGSLNCTNLMYSGSDFGNYIESCIKSLSIVSNKTFIEQVPSIAKANNSFSSVGLGLMDLHGFMASHGIMYGSKASIVFCDILFMCINFYTLRASNQMCKEGKVKPFKHFEKSDYATGKYFDEYLNELPFYTLFNKEHQDFVRSMPQSVIDLFKSIKIPTLKDWKTLQKDIEKYGLYNSYRIAIAPNQSTSYIMNSTASVMPIVDQIEVREYGNSTTYYPMPHMNNDNALYFASAYDIPQENVLDVIATIQKHVDQGISCILHIDSSASTRDIAKLFIHAYNKGLKSLYYTRTRKSTISECVSCQA